MTAVREVMTEQLVTVEPSTSVAAAVMEGIFTERDLVRALSYDIRAATSQPVGQWMTRNPVTVGPEANVEQALEIMLAGHFRHLPVTEGESLVGIVSIRDLSRAALRD